MKNNKNFQEELVLLMISHAGHKVKDINTEHITAPADRFNNITNWYIKTQREFSWSKKETQ